MKGVAAAFTAPASMSLLTTTFPEGPMRNRAFSVYTVFGASGFSLGLVLSGLLTEISWRWTLLVPAPVAAVVLAAAIWLIPRGERAARGGRKFDIPGALTITAAMLLLVYTVVSAQQAGWGSARTIGSFAAVAVLFGAFAAIERRSRDPLVPFGIFSSRALRRANIGAVTLFGSYISFQFLVTQYLQTLAGWSAMATALAFLPAGVMVVVLSTRMAALLGRFGPAPLTALAFSCLLIAYAVFLRAGVRPDYPAVMLPATLLIGLAFGLGFSSLTVAATAGVPDAEQGLAASLFQTSFQVGGAVVLAIVTAVVDASGAGGLALPRGHAGRVPARADPDHGRGRGRRAGRAERPAPPARPRCSCDLVGPRRRRGQAERWAEMMITRDEPRRPIRPARPARPARSAPAVAGATVGASTVLVQLTCHRGNLRRAARRDSESRSRSSWCCATRALAISGCMMPPGAVWCRSVHTG